MSAAAGIEPTCVKIGFEQHYGECWNDAISMIIVFSDGYKEIMQPLLYNSAEHPELIEGFLDVV